MTLGIFSLVDSVYVRHSQDGLFTAPIVIVHHGRVGDTETKKLYIRATDANTYSKISIVPVSSTDDISETPGEIGDSGWGIKLLIDPGYTPVALEWDAIGYGLPIGYVANAQDRDWAVNGIVNNETVLGFWMRIECPMNVSVQNKTSISLRLIYTEVT